MSKTISWVGLVVFVAAFVCSSVPSHVLTRVTTGIMVTAAIGSIVVIVRSAMMLAGETRTERSHAVFPRAAGVAELPVFYDRRGNVYHSGPISSIDGSRDVLRTERTRCVRYRVYDVEMLPPASPMHWEPPRVSLGRVMS